MPRIQTGRLIYVYYWYSEQRTRAGSETVTVRSETFTMTDSAVVEQNL